MKILIINGPNLNMLGKREPEIYGNKSFETYFSELQKLYPEVELGYFQSNIEGELVTELQKSSDDYNGVILNAAAYTHTSVAITDAVKMMTIPVIEVHISNIFAREAFRHHSYISPYVRGMITGLGLQGYELALKSLLP